MIDIKLIQKHQLEMLKRLTSFLENEGIQFFAVGGTALGAIRHSGFIPWDDDIDLALLRPDYEKLLSLESKLADDLFILNARNNSNYPLLFSKLMDKNTHFVDQTLVKFNLPKCVFIDLFPWDNIRNHEPYTKYKRKFRRSVYKQLGNLSEKIKYWCYKVIYGFKPTSFFYNKLLSAIVLESKEKEANWASATIAEDSLEYNDIFPLRKVAFEDTYVYIPNSCEKYLTQKYGDYMTVPPEKERVNHSTLA